MRIAALFFPLTALLCQTAEIKPDTVVLTVFERKYTRAEFEEMARAQSLNIQDPAARVEAANTVTRVRAMADEARRRGLDRNPAIRVRIENFTNAVLAQAVFDAMTAEVHQDESLARERLQDNQHFAEERQLRQILIRHSKSLPNPGSLTPEQALGKIQGLRRQVLAGAKFADVAAASSDDERTKAKGGDLGVLRQPLLIPELGEAAFRLKAGEVSEPVKTTEGYHLILVEKVFPPQFEAVRKSLEWEIARERFQQAPMTGIQMNPDYFGKR
jgi:hypothetical protein